LNPIIPPIEIPNDILTDFNIRKRIFTTSLILFLSSTNGRTKKIHCDITGLNGSQIIELKQWSRVIGKQYEILVSFGIKEF